MRIIGDIPHPRLKITIFQLNHRLSVQFEAGLLTQVYKFRSGSGIDRAEDVKKLVDARFIREVEQLMQRMHRNGSQALGRYAAAAEEDEFDDII